MKKTARMNKDFRIVFMGTPEFAVPSLNLLLENHFNIAGVVTTPDKPAGRGRRLQESPVKIAACKNNLRVLQPENLKGPGFLEQLQDLKPELQVVVAFRMLPEVVWSMPSYGTFNLHASLLPQYRGAAPINWAIMNGDAKTGLTTFFIEKAIDTGTIIFQEEVPIPPVQTAGELHDILMEKGALLVLKTVNAIQSGNYPRITQAQLSLSGKELRPAPKIFKKDCKIDWNKPLGTIYNFIRGLNPYPAAWTEMVSEGFNPISIKVYLSTKITETHNYAPGTLLSDNKGYLKVAVNGGFIDLLSIQQAGKKRMNIKEFLRGFPTISNYRIP